MGTLRWNSIPVLFLVLHFVIVLITMRCVLLFKAYWPITFYKGLKCIIRSIPGTRDLIVPNAKPGSSTIAFTASRHIPGGGLGLSSNLHFSSLRYLDALPAIWNRKWYFGQHACGRRVSFLDFVTDLQYFRRIVWYKLTPFIVFFQFKTD